MSDTTVPIMEALLRVQKNIGKVVKSSNNPHFRSKYANLDEVLDVAKKVLNEEGLVLSQLSGKDQYGQYVATSIGDQTNRSIESRVYFSGQEDNMQKIGAAITYARRFGLTSLLALESEDDDGETTVGRGTAGATTIAGRAAEAKGASIQTQGAADVEQAQAAPTRKEAKRTQLEKKLNGVAAVLVAKGITKDVIASTLKKGYNATSSKELDDTKLAAFIGNLEQLLTQSPTINQ